MKTYRTYSSEETKKAGADFAKKILAKKNPAAKSAATVIALRGDLGAGKTTFVQGFMRGLGSKKRAPSPTFVIMRRYSLKKNKKFKDVFHVDAYRLKSPKHLKALSFHEVLRNPEHIVLVEWPERIERVLPKKIKTVVFLHGKHQHERTVKIVG